MLEICDKVSTDKLNRHAVVYRHLISLNEQFCLKLFGRIDSVARVLIFNDAFSELIQMAQNDYLNNYYERIIKNTI